MELRASANSWLLWNPQRLDQIEPWQFDAHQWQQRGLLQATPGGRGGSHFISHAGGDWVVRHYCRGGLIGKLVRDRYLFTGLKQSRVYREFALLEQMWALGLPVPVPLAGRLQRHGLLASADLITERVAGARDWVSWLLEAPLEHGLWRELGRLIARFHRHGIWHADLNLRNILLDGQGQLYLIDFDRGQQRSPAQQWQADNLARLRRSCLKEAAKTPAIHFADSAWLALLQGYQD